MKICIVQYTHKILISFLIFFYALPLLFSFFLHAKLIYFIRSKHQQHYLATSNTYRLPIKRPNTLESQILVQKQRRIPNQTNLTRNQQLLQPKKIESKNRRIVLFNNNDTIRNTAGPRTTTTMTTTAAVAGQQIGTNNSSNSSGSSRSSNGTSYTSIASPITLYKVNTQANANAKRTVLLLVLLLSFYVLCWAPYNIYTWSHAYQLTINNQKNHLFNRTFLTTDFNETIKSFTDNLHSDLRRIIFINYSLYLLSMISMCFSFIFYFSLNKQARREFMVIIDCLCPWFIHLRNDNQRRSHLREKPASPRGIVYHARYQHNYPINNHPLSPIMDNNHQRMKTTKFKTHSVYVPPMVHVVNSPKKQQLSPHISTDENGLQKRTHLNYGCHIQCCP
jgi:hypothetical protein